MPVPPNPSVTITFDGTLVYTFYDDPCDENKSRKRCQIGIVRKPKEKADHRLYVRHEVTFDSLPPLKVLEKEFDCEDKSNLAVSVDGACKAEGVERFYSLRRQDAQDFRWVIDMECQEFHGECLELQPTFPEQTITIMEGLFYAYSRIPVSRTDLKCIAEETLIASPVGCNLYLNKGERFILSCDGSTPLVDFKAYDGRKDTITILNTPPNPATVPPGHDFPDYYDYVLKVPGAHFNVEKSTQLPTPISVKGRMVFGTADFPCPSIVLGSRTKAPVPTQKKSE